MSANWFQSARVLQGFSLESAQVLKNMLFWGDIKGVMEEKSSFHCVLKKSNNKTGEKSWETRTPAVCILQRRTVPVGSLFWQATCPWSSSRLDMQFLPEKRLTTYLTFSLGTGLSRNRMVFIATREIANICSNSSQAGWHPHKWKNLRHSG